MKLALALSFVASALANAPGVMTRNCVIPAAYTVASGSCTGPQVGYKVYGVCLNGLPRVQYGQTLANEVRRELVAGTNQMAFTSATDSMRPGCVVPNPNFDWRIGQVASSSMAAGLDMTLCGAVPAAAGAKAAFTTAASGVPSAGTIKGVAIECDVGYFPVRGFEGTNICINWAEVDGMATTATASIWPDALASLGGDFFAPPAFFESFNSTTITLADHVNALGYADFSSTTNSLRCAQGCTLPPALCTNGRLAANIIGTGTGLNGCALNPVRAGGLVANQFVFQCLTGLRAGTTFTYQCAVANVDATPPLIATGGFVGTQYNAECGTAYGAQTVPLWNLDGALNGWESPIQQTAGQITNFAAVTSTLRKAYSVNNAAYFTGWVRRHWNNNGAQNLMNGAVYEIIVLGCDVQPTTTARTQCTQQTLNWWRCHYNFPFYGGTICYSEFVQIACPTHELGFRCPSSSKKGLLGLLGLLGLIPLFLLCCCLLFLCCIRRRKTEADVHFATFDPHAAPVIATAPCATATACPTAFGATPFATHPSAIPCL